MSLETGRSSKRKSHLEGESFIQMNRIKTF